MDNPKIIAFHLPQYFPIPENDEWWEPGFTEWTNVAKARPLFDGHQQPNLPGESGFYDLRLFEARKKQAQLARVAGVYGFCYWHYWFGNGRRLLNEPVDRMLQDGEPSIPFMLGWANQTWSGIWHGLKDRILITQEYPGVDDVRAHCQLLTRHFAHPNYIQVEGRPLLHIYDTSSPGFNAEYLDLYRTELARHGYYPWFVLKNFEPKNRPIEGDDIVYTTVTGIDRFGAIRTRPTLKGRLIRRARRILRMEVEEQRGPLLVDYAVGSRAVERDYFDHDEIPFIYANWDNTPRSGRNGMVFVNCTPEELKRHAIKILGAARSGPLQDFCFLKSWNEWAEGNYLEPDRRYGRGWLEAIRGAIDVSQDNPHQQRRR